MSKKLPRGIRFRSDGRYEGRFQHEGEVYFVYDKTLKECDKKLTDLRYQVQNGLYAKEESITVDEWFTVWMEQYKKPVVKYGTYKLYQDEYKCHIKVPFGSKRLRDVRSEQIQKLLNGMNATYSRSTINLVKIILNSMYKQAVRNGIVVKNPVTNSVVTKKAVKKPIHVMDASQQKLFLQYAEQSMYYDLYVVGLATGLRNGELRALTWNDNIDFEAKIIKVTGTMKYIPKAEIKYMIDTPKSETSKRTVPMLEKIYQVLKQHKRKQLEMKMLLGSKWKPVPGFENLVFTSGFGGCISEQALYQDIRSIVAEIHKDGHTDFPDITPHSLRHSFASRGLEQGIPAKVMQELLGHATLAMTTDIYMHSFDEQKAAEIRKLEGLF